MLPDCQDGQLVGIDASKNLTCVSALSGMLTPPNCLPGTQALTSLKDTVTGNNVLSCINKGSGANDVTTTTRINNATTNIMNLQNSVTMITTGGGNRGKYIGSTPLTMIDTMSGMASKTGGAIFSGTIEGVRAASKICENAYSTGAHMCTPFEIYESLIIGDKIDGSTDIGPLTVYMEAWVPPFASGGSEPNAGLSENCGAHTYPTADRKWHNTHFTFKTPAAGGSTRVAKFDASVGCSATAPIACCK